MKSRLLIIIGAIATLAIIFFVLGPSQGHIAKYFLTNEQFEDMILGDNSHVSDSRDTKNPNECWYQEDDGNITPCRMGPDVDGTGMFLILFWPYIILGIVIVIIFIVWRIRK